MRFLDLELLLLFLPLSLDGDLFLGDFLSRFLDRDLFLDLDLLLLECDLDLDLLLGREPLLFLSFDFTLLFLDLERTSGLSFFIFSCSLSFEVEDLINFSSALHLFVFGMLKLVSRFLK